MLRLFFYPLNRTIHHNKRRKLLFAQRSDLWQERPWWIESLNKKLHWKKFGVV
jgi:hypothetical protein